MIQADLNPDRTGMARLNRGTALIAAGRAAEAVDTLRNSFAEIRLPVALGRYGAALAAAGRKREAEEVLRQLLSYVAAPVGPSNYVAPPSGVYVAYIYAALGERAMALNSLERAAASRDADFPSSAIDPAFDTLRSEPRFQALRKRVGL